MKKSDIEKLEQLIGKIDGLYREIGSLVKKSAKDGVNKFKLKFINQVLLNTNTFLGKKSLPLDNFECFNEEELPSNSDVTFILTQYSEALELYRSDNIFVEYGNRYYKLKSGDPIRTAPPASITRKAKR